MIIHRNTNKDTVSITYNSYVNGQKASAYTIDGKADTVSKTTYLKTDTYLMEIVNHVNLGHADSTWEINNKIKLQISMIPNAKHPFRTKTIYQYDPKGNEIQSVHYKQYVLLPVPGPK